MRPVTFLERFTEFKDKLDKKDTSKFEEQFAIQVTMTDEDCRGIFYIANAEDGFSVEPYDYRDHTAHVIIDSQDLMDMIDGKLDAVKAYLEGKVKVEGNLEHVKLVASLKEKPKRKTAAKKPAAEKKAAGVKKTAKPKTVSAKTVRKKKEPEAKIEEVEK